MISELRNFIESLKELPTISPVATKLLEISSDEKCGIRDVSKIIESDPSLSSKIIRLANFSHLNAGHCSEVDTVHRAISLLGLNMVRCVALSVSTINLLNSDLQGEFDPVDFWAHSISCAIASELFAKHFSFPHPDTAFFAGLLHDLGKYLLFNWKRDRYNKVVTKAKITRTRLLEKEEAHLGFGHTQAAKILMEQWNFPKSLILPAWLHHQPLTEFGTSQFESLPFIVKCANSLCHIQRFGYSNNPVGDMDTEELIESARLGTKEKLKIFSTRVLERFEEVSKLFNWKNTTADLYISSIIRSNKEISDIHIKLEKANRKHLLLQTTKEMINKLYETLEPPISIGKSMSTIMEILSKTISNKQLSSFACIWSEKIIELWINTFKEGDFKRLTLPLDSSIESKRDYNPEEIASIIKSAVTNENEKSSILIEDIINVLNSANLIILPIKSEAITFGLIMIESDIGYLTEEEQTVILDQFIKTTGQVIRQVLHVKALDQQSEDIARISRKAYETKKQLYHVERLASVGRLAAGAAHEINNPLSAITLKAQILQSKTKDDIIFDGLNLIVQQSFRIAKITKELMGVARPSESQFETSNIITIIKQAVNLLENQIKLANINVYTEFKHDTLMIYSDPKQIEQVFLNLIVNAMHAMENGGDLIIKTKTAGEKHELKVEIEDTGTGIEPENITKIFNPFYTSKKSKDGTGLGLSISKSIIEEHKGTLTVTSKSGKGSVFTVCLPLEKNTSIKEVTANESDIKHNIFSDTQIRTMSVLIIDDDEVMRSTLTESLSLHGYEIDAAVDGTDGIIKAAQKKYNVIILDLNMPRRTGLHVLDIIKKIDNDLPIIVISGVALETEFHTAKKAGAFACIKKPFSITDLLATVNKATTLNCNT